MSGAEIWQRLVSGAEAFLAAAAREVVLAAVVFAVVWLACRALRGRRGVPPRLVHGLWALVLVRLVLPPGLGAPVGVGAVLGGWDAWREWMPAAEWSVGATADEAVVSVGQAGPEAQVHGLDPVTGAPLDGRPEAAAGNRRRGSVTAGAGGIWAPALVGLWLLGSGFVLALLGRRKRFYRRAVFAAGGAEPWVEEMAERWRGLLGVRRRVELRVGERRLPPFTAGVIRPVIFLPRTLVVRGGREAVEAAVAHEMAHVARLDALWLALQNAVQVVWFFNPLARAAAARLLDARERAADELVVARGAMPPRRYAAGLVAALSLGLATPGGPPPAPALGSSKRGVSVRIEEILRRRPGGSNPLLPALLCGLAAVLLLPLAAPASELPPAAPETPEAPALEAAPMAPEAPALAEPPSAPSAAELPSLPTAPSAAELPPPPSALSVAAVPAVAPVPSAPPAPAVPAAPRPAPAPVPAPAAVPAPAPPPAQAPEPAAAPAPVAAPVPAPAPVAPAALTSPLREARVTSGFGDRKDPKDGQVRLHRGLDLGAPVGTPVHAPATGVVRLADEHHGDDGRLGKTVVLDHGDGLETLYAHLESIAVREGQRVEAGEVIGRVGSSGVSTGAHLHLEVLQDGRPIDPMARIPGLSDR